MLSMHAHRVENRDVGALLTSAVVFFLSGLWLLIEQPVVSLPCAALLFIQGLRVISSVVFGSVSDHRSFRILLGLLLCIPFAVEAKSLWFSRTEARASD